MNALKAGPFYSLSIEPKKQNQFTSHYGDTLSCSTHSSFDLSQETDGGESMDFDSSSLELSSMSDELIDGHPYHFDRFRVSQLFTADDASPQRVPEVYFLDEHLSNSDRCLFDFQMKQSADTSHPKACSKDDSHENVLSDVSNKDLTAHTPVPFTPFRTINQCHFLSRGTDEDHCGYALKENASPETKKMMEKEVGKPLYAEYNENGSPYKAYKEVNGEFIKLALSIKAGGAYTFSSETYTLPFKIIEELNAFKSLDKESLEAISQGLEKSGKKLPAPPLTQLSGASLITLKELENLEGTRKEDPITQRKALGMSAREVFTHLGAISSESGDAKHQFHILHIRARSLPCAEGEDPHSPQNFVVGTAAANGQHLVVLEEIVKSFVTENTSVIYSYRINDKQKIFNANWHLCQFIEFEVHEAQKERIADYHARKITIDQLKGKLLKKYTLDTLAVNYPHRADQQSIKAFDFVQRLRGRGFTSDDEDAPTLKRPNDLTDRDHKRKSKKPKCDEDMDYVLPLKISRDENDVYNNTLCALEFSL